MADRLYIDTLTPAELAAVERRMRPGNASSAGFLGRGESLRNCIERDAATLARHGVTHYEAARWLEDMLNRIPKGVDASLRFSGYEAKGVVRRGIQGCPFGSYACGMTNVTYQFTKRSTQEGFSISGLLPHLIGTHQFFEGNTPYRLDPERLLEMRAHIPHL
ncbi:TPA: hypothetical protein HA251_03160 [Candidatus Woesearchaeota archaeon]|nr:hypothetical protein [Candidatus Woesearchaeota archaeon]